jgi:hypothetical protein
MRLLVNGGSIAVAQMGPDFLLVDAPFHHRTVDATEPAVFYRLVYP